MDINDLFNQITDLANTLGKRITDLEQSYRRHKHKGQAYDQTDPLTDDSGSTTPPPTTSRGPAAIIPFTRNLAVGGFTTLPHGLGRVPTHVSSKGICNAGSGLSLVTYGEYNGTTEWCNWFSKGNNGQPQANTIQGFGSLIFQPNVSGLDYNIAIITFDITNIYINWASSGSPSGTAQAILEVY